MKPIIGPGAKCRGYLRESGDRIELLSPEGRLLGIFLIQQNLTIRPGAGGLVGYGNQLMSLLED